MQQASPVLQQQLRSLHTLHHQSPDGTLYPGDVYQQQYALSGPPQQQAPSHGLPVHFEQQHALSPQGPYQPFQPANYQHATSPPRFMNAPASTLQDAQQYHTSPPQRRPIQQLPLPPPAPILTEPIPLAGHVDQGHSTRQPEGHDRYVSPKHISWLSRCK
jgi:glutathione S-transferase